MRGEIAGAVDFGSREVRVLIGRRDDEGSIQIIGHGAAPGHGCVSQGVIQDVGAAQRALRAALSDAEREARIKLYSVFSGVNGRNVETFIREGYVKLERELVEQSDMEEALDIASRDVLAAGKRITSSIAAQEWYLDDLRVADPVGIRGHVLKTRVHFARVPAVIEDNIITCIESQRREVEDIIFLPIASALGCLYPEDMELGVAVIDMGRTTSGLAVYRDHRILGTHSFEWGCYHLTRDVAAGLHISFEEADELILEYGISDRFVEEELKGNGEDVYADVSKHAEDDLALEDRRNNRIKLKSPVHGAPPIVDREELDIIVYERARELMIKVRQQLQARGFMDSLVRGVVLTGGGGAIKNNVKLAEAIFQKPCRVGVPNSIDILPHNVAAPEYSAAIGIIRHAFNYRTAARNGRIEPRNRMAGGLRRMSKALKKYFF